ncbi:Homeobox protein HD-5 [Dictyocoela muelleri]|nr:Homeobox protein HD-5 [Dictyocoela muelleri]
MKRKIKRFKDYSDKIQDYYNGNIKKRSRLKYSDMQKKYLEETYRQNRYPNILMKMNVASNIGIPHKSVNLWFQNRRVKEKIELERKTKNNLLRINLNYVFKKQIDPIICNFKVIAANKIKKVDSSEFYDELLSYETFYSDSGYNSDSEEFSLFGDSIIHF